MAKAKNKLSSTFIMALIVLVAALAVGGTMIYNHFHKQTVVNLSSSAKTTSKLPTAQSNYDSGTSRTSGSSTLGQGGGTDNQGSTPSSSLPPSSEWTTSSSGAITLEDPVSNQVIQSGVTIFGTSTVSTVQYRLIDNSVGVIDTGSLNVVNGQFSGTLNFKSYASSGQLDVYSYDSNGAEINEIELSVNF